MLINVIIIIFDSKHSTTHKEFFLTIIWAHRLFESTVIQNCGLMNFVLN